MTVSPSSLLKTDPSQSPSLARLQDLASNLWWSWTPQARQVFEALDQTLWRHTQHNPVKQLQEVKPERLAKLANDIVFVRQYTAALKAFDEYLAATDHWFGGAVPPPR